MSIYAILSFLSFFLFIAAYVAYFLLREKRAKLGLALLVAFLLLGLACHAFLVGWGINLFGEEAPSQAKWIGLLLGLFLSSCFYFPFAKKASKKTAAADMALFLLSGIAFIVDAISIAYQMLSQIGQ